jgi:hypothetical protein
MQTLFAIAALALFAIGGCASDAPPGPDGEIDFEGTWFGNIGDPALVQRTNVKWTPTHVHSTVSGPIVFQLSPTLTATGTLTGSVVGTAVEFTLKIPAGSFPPPVSPACAMTGSGATSAASETDIVAMILIHYSQPCVGTVTNVTITTHRLTLIKVS